MKTMHRWFRLLLALLLGAGLFASQTASAASGSVSPQQGTAGTRFTFTANGFEDGEQVDFWLTAPDSSTIPRFPSVNAERSGQVVWTWDAPTNVQNGTWRMTARGNKTDVRVVISFTISGATAAPPPANTNSVTPTSGPPGTVFNFSAAGFRANERVGSWLNRPDGTNVELRTPDNKVISLVADANGQLAWSWTAPADAQGGTWQVIARGLGSDVQVTIPFQVVTSASAPVRSVAPTSGQPGTTFTFTVGGFGAGEMVGSWLNRPDGGRVDAIPELKADAAGVVTWRWTAPNDAPGGTWNGVTRGRDNGLEVVLPFSISGPGAAPAPNTPTGSVSPASGPPGTSFTFSATGFAANETVDYWPTTPQGTPDPNSVKATADQNGNVTWQWVASERAAPGEWVMTARGASSRRVLEIRFTVQPPASSPTPTSVAPTSGGPGTVFRFTAQGFNVIEKLDTWFNTPVGGTAAGPQGVRADGKGMAAWEWTAPADVAGGNWQMVVRGRDTGITYSIPFTIVRDAPPPPANNASVAPTSGGPGTTFSFTANGYENQERVGYWLNTPDGSVIRFDRELTANNRGEVTWEWTAPADAQRGSYTMVARSSQNDRVQNDVTHTITFVVQ